MTISWPARRLSHPHGILIIEDDRDVAHALQASLHREAMEQGANCEVLSVASLEEAQAVLQAAQTGEGPFVDSIVLDLGLEHSGGIETLRRLREFTALPGVVYTGADDPKGDLADQCVQLGMYDLLGKPTEAPRIYRTLRLSTIAYARNLAREEREAQGQAEPVTSA